MADGSGGGGGGAGGTSMVELVKFAAEGLDEIEAQTESLQDAVKRAYAQQYALSQLLKDPAYLKAARDAESLAKANREKLRPAALELSRIEKERQVLAERGAALRSGAYRREQADLVSLRKETERLALAERRDRLGSGAALRGSRVEAGARLANGRLDLAERRQVLDSGLYAKTAAASGRLRYDEARLGLAERRTLLGSGEYAAGVGRREALKREEEALARGERRAELRAMHGGRLGGAMYAAERAMPLTGAVGALGATGLGMARSGFAGTVEQNALTMELKLINREIANALVPALRELTGGVRWVRQNLDRLGPRGQKILAAGVIGASAIGTTAVGVAGFGHILNGLRGAGLLRAVPAVATTGMSADLAATAGVRGAGIAGSATGGAANAVATTSRWGRLGQLGGAAGRLAGKVSTPLAIAANLYDQTTDIASDPSTLRSLGRQSVRGADVLFGGEAARMFGYKSGGPLGQMYDLAFGENKGRDSFSWISWMGGGEGKKSQALIADSGFETFDSSYQRTASAVSLMDAANAGTNQGTQQNIEDELKRLNERMAELVRLQQEAAARGGPPLR